MRPPGDLLTRTQQKISKKILMSASLKIQFHPCYARGGVARFFVRHERLGGCLTSRPKSKGLAALAVVLLALIAGPASAQITSIDTSNVERFFGTQSDFIQQSEGPTNPPPWGVNSPGPYPNSGIPTVPPLYGTFPNPVLPGTSNISFAAPAGHQ
jgi:hypothetical protein